MKATLTLNKLQWTLLSNCVKIVAQNAPIEGWELHSLVIAKCYKRLLQQFTFYTHKNNALKLSLLPDEAYAINEYFAANSDEYNVFIRLNLEPQLLPPKIALPQ